ncbi:MAG: cob(I)yrinic acid a,c-diamide adenosyltransferase [Gammaproteobacteria bacterium]|nr:cob(I)yrinic acid a,c-diamide adenosyltransferase [Gammaproteobacteria bacterium]
MAYRISRVTTSKGDQGTTKLADGKTLDKFDGRVELSGTLDEANCSIGVLVQHVDDEYRQTLVTIQSRIFDLGAAVATGDPQPIWQRETDAITEATKELNEELPPLREFVLPGGGKASAFAHVARSNVRRAERVFWKHAPDALKDAGLGAFLNRVSDYLFVLSRIVAEQEQLWEPLRS